MSWKNNSKFLFNQRAFKRNLLEKNLTSFQEIQLIAFLTILSTMATFAADVYFPSLPAIKNDFNATNYETQLTLSVFLLGLGLTQIPFGILSDYIGRRKLLLINLIIFLSASLGCIFSESIYSFILFRFLQGVGSSAALVVGRSLYLDILPEEKAKRAITLSIPFVCISPGVAPILGGVIDYHLGWQYSFIFISLIVLCLLVGYYILFPETKDFSKNSGLGFKGFFKLSYRVLFIPGFLPVMSVLLTTDSIWWSYLASAPQILKHYGYSSETIGLCYVPAVLPYFIVSMLAPKVCRGFKTQHFIYLGLSLIFLAMIYINVMDFLNLFSPFVLLSGIVVMSIGDGFSFPAVMSYALSCSPKMPAVASGIVGTVQIFAGILASVLAGFCHNCVVSTSYVHRSLILFFIGLSLYLIFNRILPIKKA